MKFTSNTHNAFIKKKTRQSLFCEMQGNSESLQNVWSTLMNYVIVSAVTTIKDFTQLEEAMLPQLKFLKKEDYILIYIIVFDPETPLQFIKECIRIDQNLHGQPQCDGTSILLL